MVKAAIADTEPVDMVRWMIQNQDATWQPFSKEISRELETARQAGEEAKKLVHNARAYKVSLQSLVASLEGDSSAVRLRRHLLKGTEEDLWSMLSIKYDRY